jgi:DNA repair protein RadC
MLVHNHPSGCSQASPEDKALTKQLTKVLGMIDIKVLDHFIIGDQEITSFAEKGWI